MSKMVKFKYTADDREMLQELKCTPDNFERMVKVELLNAIIKEAVDTQMELYRRGNREAASK